MRKRRPFRLYVRFDRGPRTLRPLLVLALPLLLAGELSSENVTLSTYYPAPSGVYTRMLTTGDTVLARDGGGVGIGTQTPSGKLDVNGDMVVRGDFTASNNIVLGGVARNTWPGLGAGSVNATVVNWVPAPWSGTHSGDCPPGYVVTGAQVSMRGTCQNKCDGDGPIWGALVLHCRQL